MKLALSMQGKLVGLVTLLTASVLLVAVVLALLLSDSSFVQADTLSATSLTDSEVREDSPTINTGSQDTMRVTSGTASLRPKLDVTLMVRLGYQGWAAETEGTHD